MAGRRGARTGRGWDASPPRADSAASPRRSTLGRSGSRAKRPERAEPEHESTRDPGELAREIALELLAARPRTRAELATALRRRGVAEDVATDLLDRYDEVGIVDDGAFARAWVTSRHHSRGLAKRALASELRQRGVDSDKVSEALDELDPQTEESTARDLVARKLRTMSSKSQPDQVVRRLVGMLARKGYPPGLAFRVVKDALADSGGLSELADDIDADALAEAAESAEAAETADR